MILNFFAEIFFLRLNLGIYDYKSGIHVRVPMVEFKYKLFRFGRKFDFVFDTISSINDPIAILELINLGMYSYLLLIIDLLIEGV